MLLKITETYPPYLGAYLVLIVLGAVGLGLGAAALLKRLFGRRSEPKKPDAPSLNTSVAVALVLVLLLLLLFGVFVFT